MLRLSVLLVDDDPRFLSIAAEFLQGFEEIAALTTAEGGQAALDIASDLRPQVVLIDMNMPGISGLEALPRLRAELPGATIIAFSVTTAQEYGQAALAAGADLFIPKQNLGTELLPAIRRLASARPDQTVAS